MNDNCLQYHIKKKQIQKFKKKSNTLCNFSLTLIFQYNVQSVLSFYGNDFKKIKISRN